MFWGPLLLAITGIYAGGVAFYLHKKSNRLMFMGLFWAALIFTFTEFSYLVSHLVTGSTAVFITSQMAEWGQVYCVAFVLAALLLFVRESKPEFSRFPKLYTAFPFIIILSYLLVHHTIILKNWLMNIYQAGAVIVAVLIYGIYGYRESIYQLLAIGSGLFFITFCLYLLLPNSSRLVWEIFLMISIVTTFIGYLVVYNNYNQMT